MRQLLRSAVPADLPAILQLLAQDAIRYVDEPAGITDRQRTAIDEIIVDPNAELIVGELDGRVVSTAMVNYLRVLSFDGGLVCQIEAVRTAAELRGQGLGRELIEHLLTLAEVRGCVRAQLTSNRQRTRARVFYGRLGFEVSHLGFKLALPRRAAG